MEPPIKPSDSDCCNSGCNPCILDVYEAQLRKYKTKGSVLSSESKNCISQTTYTIFKLISIQCISSTINLYTFKYIKPLQSESTHRDLTLVYKPGQHFLLKGHTSCDEQFTRAYTPIPKVTAPLCFSVIIKLYKNGIMSKYIETLNVDSETLWRGPYGNYDICYDHKYILTIAQGTGIAPIYSVLHEMLNHEDCDTLLNLYLCCRNANEILFRDELYELGLNWNFKYHVFVLNAVGFQPKYREPVLVERLGRSQLQTYLEDKVDKDLKVLICGSEDFSNSMVEHVKRCGLDENKIFVF